MFLPATNAKPKKKKENEEGLSDSFNGGGLIASTSARYDARSYSSKTEYPSAEPGTGDIGMEGYYVKPKSYGKTVYRRPSVPAKKDEEKTDVKEPESAESKEPQSAGGLTVKPASGISKQSSVQDPRGDTQTREPEESAAPKESGKLKTVTEKSYAAASAPIQTPVKTAPMQTSVKTAPKAVQIQTAASSAQKPVAPQTAAENTQTSAPEENTGLQTVSRKEKTSAAAADKNLSESVLKDTSEKNGTEKENGNGHGGSGGSFSVNNADAETRKKLKSAYRPPQYSKYNVWNHYDRISALASLSSLTEEEKREAREILKILDWKNTPSSEDMLKWKNVYTALSEKATAAPTVQNRNLPPQKTTVGEPESEAETVIKGGLVNYDRIAEEEKDGEKTSGKESAPEPYSKTTANDAHQSGAKIKQTERLSLITKGIKELDVQTAELDKKEETLKKQIKENNEKIGELNRKKTVAARSHGYYDNEADKRLRESIEKSNGEISAQIKQIQTERKSLETLKKLYVFETLREAEDFADKSAYKTKQTGGNATQSAGSAYYYLSFPTDAYDDALIYEYVNDGKTPDGKSIRGMVEANDVSVLSGTKSHTYLKKLDAKQTALFNYIFETKGAKTAREYLDIIAPEEFTKIASLAFGFLDGLGVESAAVAVGKAIGLFNKEISENATEFHKEYKKDSVAAAAQNPTAYGIGSVTGNVAMMTAMSQAVNPAVTKGVGALTGSVKSAKTIKSVTKTAQSALTYALSSMLHGAGDAATGEITLAEYLKDAVKNGFSGAVSELSSILSDAAYVKVLKELDLTQELAWYVKDVAKGMTGATAYIGADYVLSKEKPSAKEIKKQFFISFGFTLIRSACETYGASRDNKARIKQITEKLEKASEKFSSKEYTSLSQTEKDYITRYLLEFADSAEKLVLNDFEDPNTFRMGKTEYDMQLWKALRAFKEIVTAQGSESLIPAGSGAPTADPAVRKALNDAFGLETNAQNAISQGETTAIPQVPESLDNKPQIKDNENADKNIKETNNSSSMPNCNKAVTPKEKFFNYSLDPANSNATGKAEAYKNALGYTKENAEELIEKISDAVISEKVKPYDISKTEYGIKYKFRISITGPNGNTRNVIAVYQIDADGDTPRMITNYVEGRK